MGYDDKHDGDEMTLFGGTSEAVILGIGVVVCLAVLGIIICLCSDGSIGDTLRNWGNIDFASSSNQMAAIFALVGGFIFLVFLLIFIAEGIIRFVSFMRECREYSKD